MTTIRQDRIEEETHQIVGWFKYRTADLTDAERKRVVHRVRAALQQEIWR